jgi:RHS repeat-associated protein
VVSASTGTLLTEAFNDTGQRRDETGLLYYNARYYDPAIGRFLSADTIVPGAGALTVAPGDATAAAAWGQGGGGPADPQALNRYTYAGNNPVRNTDPTGHCVEPLSGTICVGGALLAKFLFDVVVVVVGGALIYDSVNQMADSLPNDASGTAPGAEGLPAEGGQGQSEQEAEDEEDGATAFGSTLKPGPFAGESIPARGPGTDFTAEEREEINRIGRTTGCHMCGATDPGTKSGNFIPDHQPPSKLNDQGADQRLYPHCLRCSLRQGGEVRETLRQRHNPQ